MSTPLVVTYYKAAERPDIALWLQDDAGALINFSVGYTFVFKIGYLGETALLTKSTGITGAAGSGAEDAGVPNLVITPSAGELDVVAASLYDAQIKATSGGLDRFYQFKLELLDVIL